MCILGRKCLSISVWKTDSEGVSSEEGIKKAFTFCAFCSIYIVCLFVNIYLALYFRGRVLL